MKKVRLNDQQLLERMLSYRTNKAAENAGKELAAADRDAVADELKARGKKSLVIGGIRVTVTESQDLVNVGLAKRVLNRVLYRAVTRESINKEAWEAAKKEGVLTEAMVQACTVATPMTPRIRLTDQAAPAITSEAA